MDEKAFKEGILAGLEYSYRHDDWVNPLDEALGGLSAEDALWRPGGELKGIWDIVLHLAVWNDNIVDRMKTGEKARPKEGAWPPIPNPADEAAWEASKRRLWDSLRNLEQSLSASTPEGLMAGPYGLGDLLCRFVHNGYHLGQITKLREIKGF